MKLKNTPLYLFIIEAYDTCKKHDYQTLEKIRIERIGENVKLLKKNITILRKENIKSNKKLLTNKKLFSLINKYNVYS